MASVHRDHDRIHSAGAGDVERLSERLGVQSVEAAVPCGVDPGALGWWQDSADGDHAPLG